MQKHYDETYINNVQQPLTELKERSYTLLPNEPAYVADIGCGAGTDVMRMAHRFPQHQFTGIDHDEKFIQSAENTLDAEGVSNVSFQTGDIMQLPHHDNRFDAVRLDRILQHIPDLKGALEEVYRILKTGGDLVIVETDWSSLKIYHENTVFFDALVAFYANTKIPQGKIVHKLPAMLDKNKFKTLSLHIEPFVVEGMDLLDTFFYLQKGMNEVAVKHQFKEQHLQALMSDMKEAATKWGIKASINLALIHAKKD